MKLLPADRRFFGAVICVIALFFLCSPNILKAKTVYFLVGEIYSGGRNDSYVLPLDDPCDIEYARDLAEGIVGEYGTIVVAAIDRWDPGIGICPNRNYLAPGIPAWSWYVTAFEGFGDITMEILDGWPGDVEKNAEGWIQNTNGYIGFWGYTVVAELGTDLEPWTCDFTVDGIVDSNDLAWFCSHWLDSGCGHRYYCEGADIDGSGRVNFHDFAIFAGNWLWLQDANLQLSFEFN